jgi:hypothetical protein
MGAVGEVLVADEGKALSEGFPLLGEVLERGQGGALYFRGTRERVFTLFEILASGMNYQEHSDFAKVPASQMSEVIPAAGYCFEHGIGLVRGQPDPRQGVAELNVGRTFRRYELRAEGELRGIPLDSLWGTLSSGESLYIFCDSVQLKPELVSNVSQIIRVAGQMLERGFEPDEGPAR